MVDDAPEGVPPFDLPAQEGVFAPDYAPEEIAEIARKLRQAAGLPDEPTGVVANDTNGRRRQGQAGRLLAMATLTKLESKVAEVLGLAMAAQDSTRLIRGMLSSEHKGLSKKLEQAREEARETQKRCTALASSFKGKKTAILEKAREVKGEATEMREAYLGGEDDPLDGFEFLTMAEAGEVGHWAIVGKLNERAGKRPAAHQLGPADSAAPPSGRARRLAEARSRRGSGRGRGVAALSRLGARSRRPRRRRPDRCRSRRRRPHAAPGDPLHRRAEVGF